MSNAYRKKNGTCLCGHSGPGAPLLKYHGNGLALQEWETLQIETTALANEASTRRVVG